MALSFVPIKKFDCHNSDPGTAIDELPYVTSAAHPTSASGSGSGFCALHITNASILVACDRSPPYLWSHIKVTELICDAALVYEMNVNLLRLCNQLRNCFHDLYFISA